MIICIADDDAVSRVLTEKAVADLGYETVSAGDGTAAWRLVEERDVRIVLADWEMPGMSGPSLASRIRSEVRDRYVYVILLTSRTENADVIKGLDAGADDYIIKPFNRSALSARLRIAGRIVGLEMELSAKNGALAGMNAKLEEMARTDPLLGIGNRRGLYEILDAACSGPRCVPFAVIMADIDNFKSYNDTFGHIAGDTTLRLVAGALKSCLRDTDGLFRYGGEEILAFLPAATAEAAEAIARRMCSAVADLGIEHPNSATGVVTISCGSSTLDCAGEERSWEGVIALADRALYAAKAAGKNRAEAIAAGR